MDSFSLMGIYHINQDDEHLHLMTLQDFRVAVGQGVFIDYDGYGHYARNGVADDSAIALPSEIDKMPEWATHVVWFNR